MSLAVRVLQKNSVGCLFCLRPISDAKIASFSYCGTDFKQCLQLVHISNMILKGKKNAAYYQIEQLTYFVYGLKCHLSIDLISFRISLISERE